MSKFIPPLCSKRIISLTAKAREIGCVHLENDNSIVSDPVDSGDEIRPYIIIETVTCTKCGSVIEKKWLTAYKGDEGKFAREIVQ